MSSKKTMQGERGAVERFFIICGLVRAKRAPIKMETSFGKVGLGIVRKLKPFRWTFLFCIGVQRNDNGIHVERKSRVYILPESYVYYPGK